MRFNAMHAIVLVIAALIALAFGWLAPRAPLLGWLTVVAPLAAAVLGAAMLTCILRLGRSRLLDAWNAPLSIAVPWLYALPLLCIPFVAGVGTLYGWNDAAFADQRAYLNAPFFVVRALVYFAAFIGIAIASPTARRESRLAVLLLIAFIATNMIGFDMVMALTPQWHSSDFGLRWCVNGLLTAASFAVAWHAIRVRGANEEETRSRIDGATLLFALDLGWLYLMFVDYVTAWSGNLPDEVVWYAPRMHGAWGIVIVCVVTAHLIAGLLLLSRTIKRSSFALLWIAALMLVVQWIEAIWTIVPGTAVGAGVAIGDSMLSIVVLVIASFGWLHFAPRFSRRLMHGQA